MIPKVLSLDYMLKRNEEAKEGNEEDEINKREKVRGKGEIPPLVDSQQ